MQGEWTGAARPGDRIGPYTVLAELASGGMGRVYLARSPGGRTVAVKTVLGAYPGESIPEEDRRRFTREVALAQRVRGVFTASVVDADAAADVPWMATEYVPAPSLRELVSGQGTLPPAALYWIAAGMVEALVSLHAAGLVHRDVKPSNVLLPEDGPRLIDFGISQAADATRTKAATGTIAFAAPEQARGERTTPASDVFSLGATLFFLLTGRSPYRDMGEGTALEQLVRAASGDLDLSGLPTEVDTLIRPCLAVDADARPTPQELLTRIGPVLAERPQDSGATDWLPERWATAIERHRRRRTEEAEAARRRVDPEAVTERAPDNVAPTRALPPPHAPGPAPAGRPRYPSPPPRSRRTGVVVGVAVGLAVLVAGLGLVLLLRQGGDDGDRGGGGAPGAVREDLRLALVEQSADGACDDQLPPPTFTASDPSICYQISTRAEDRMTVTQLKEVEAAFDERGGGWLIRMTFQEEDGERFADLSERAATRQTPKNQIAIVLGDRLLSAPAVTERISGGNLQIAGSFTKASAEELARELGAR